MEKNWIAKIQPEQQQVSDLASDTTMSPVLCSLLIQRGITVFEEAKAFFRPHLNQLHDPFLMRDMDRAVDRLQEALESDQKIMVYGDYDVDGTTAVTVVYAFLQNIGAQCVYYIPNRYKEGYGFSFLAVEHAKEIGINLIILVFKGTVSRDFFALVFFLNLFILVLLEMP
ncbi:MAG: DHH family phosphoesterase [Flavobacteriales bacterium]